MTFDDRVSAIRETGKSVPHCVITAYVNIPGKAIEMHRVELLTVDRNYLSCYGDEVILEGYMPLGNFVKFVDPNKANLTVTIIETRDKMVFKNVYKAIILNGENSSQDDMLKNSPTDTLNVETAYIKFNLIDVHLDYMYYNRTTGIVENKTVLDVMTTILNSEWSKDPHPDTYKKQLSIIPPHNTSTQKQFMFPSFMKTLDLPLYIQKHYHGVYDGDIGVYIQQMLDPVVDDSPILTLKNRYRVLWVYPLINESMKNRKFRRLNVFLTKDKRDAMVDKTFKLVSSYVELLATSSDRITLISAMNHLSEKTKVATYNIADMENRNYQTSDESTIKVNGNLSSVRMDSYPKDSNITDEGVTANSFQTKTNEMLLNRTVISVDWNNSVPDLLFPGMRVRLFIKDDGITKHIDGILSGCSTLFDNIKSKCVSKLYITLKV